MFKKIGLAVITLAVLCFIIFAQSGDKDEKTSITVTELQEKIQNEEEIVILDVRSQSEYEGKLGHLENSILIPLSDLEDRLEELEKYKKNEMIVICARGIRSDMAAKLLRENGFNALNLSGGMIAYRAMEKEDEEESNNEVIKEKQ